MKDQMKIAISAGHSSKCPGAADIIDEVTEARRVCVQVCDYLLDADIPFEGPYFDDISTDKNECLERICDWHNAQTRDLDVSVHLNQSDGGTTSKPIGTEVWHMTQEQLATDVATAIADAGELIDRGPKYSSGLYFLTHTEAKAILIEVCFVNSRADVDAYQNNFLAICEAIASTLAGQEIGPAPGPEPEPDDALLHVSGSCSWFGGPDDGGVSPSEGLAFLYEVSDAPELFLPTQPPGTTGLARRLDPETFYIACRWDYDVTSKEYLRDQTRKALVRANGREFLAQPADWGPHEDTGRVADLSPGLMEALGISTDEEVEVIYPAPDDVRPPGPEPERAVVNIEISASGPVEVIVNGTPIGEF